MFTKNGLKPDPSKVQAVKEIPNPQPLRDLIAKEAKFIWPQQHENTFKEVREVVVKHPVLKYYDLEEEVTVQCDASEYGLGAALLQNGQPVVFASRSLSQTGWQYAQIEKECLEIVFSCERFSQYLPGREKITFESDHKS